MDLRVEEILDCGTKSSELLFRSEECLNDFEEAGIMFYTRLIVTPTLRLGFKKRLAVRKNVKERS